MIANCQRSHDNTDVMTRADQGEFNVSIESVTHSKYVMSLVKLAISVNEMTYWLG